MNEIDIYREWHPFFGQSEKGRGGENTEDEGRLRLLLRTRNAQPPDKVG